MDRALETVQITEKYTEIIFFNKGLNATIWQHDYTYLKQSSCFMITWLAFLPISLITTNNTDVISVIQAQNPESSFNSVSTFLSTCKLLTFAGLKFLTLLWFLPFFYFNRFLIDLFTSWLSPNPFCAWLLN